MTLIFSPRHLRAELSISMEVSLDGGVHINFILGQRPVAMLAAIQHPKVWKAKPELFTGGGNSRGADLTHPHERHREAPMRETRQAAPDGARAPAALSSSESSRFSRGTKPMRRKSYGFVVMSSFAVNSIAGNIFNKFRWRLQHSRAVRHISRRPATVPGDENLRAKTPAAAGGSRQERKRERLSERPVDP